MFSQNIKLQKINLINIEYKQKNAFQKISSKSNKYIKQSFDIGLKIMRQGISNKFINGPISKEKFLKNKYIGVTEYLAKNKRYKFCYGYF